MASHHDRTAPVAIRRLFGFAFLAAEPLQRHGSRHFTSPARDWHGLRLSYGRCLRVFISRVDRFRHDFETLPWYRLAAGI